MKRRDFLRLSYLIGLGAALKVRPGFAIPVEGIPDIAVAQGESPSAITRAAIGALGGIKRFISKGDVVVVKPNMAFDRLPEHAANTNPEVAATVVKLCFEAGAKKVSVFDRTVNEPRRVYVQSGIAEASAKAGADVSFIDDRKFREVSINGIALTKWYFYRDVLEADKLINIPIAKHHSLTRLTMAMKNWMGVIGGRRDLLHQRIHESIVDLSLVIKPTLTILDAVRILVRGGPQGGDLKNVEQRNTIIAGVDQVAVDAYGATLFGLKGKDIKHLAIASDKGLGRIDIENLSIRQIKL